jgi:hypothetical protein
MLASIRSCVADLGARAGHGEDAQRVAAGRRRLAVDELLHALPTADGLLVSGRSISRRADGHRFAPVGAMVCPRRE